MAGSSKAWVLELGGGLMAAIGERQLQHLVHQPSLHHVPRTPPHASQVLFWTKGVLPLVNMTRMILGDDNSAACLIAGVVVYQTSSSAPLGYGAISLAGPPRRIVVSDELACPLPVNLESWGFLFNACFEWDGQPVPVLALDQVFPANPA